MFLSWELGIPLRKKINKGFAKFKDFVHVSEAKMMYKSNCLTCQTQTGRDH